MGALTRMQRRPLTLEIEHYAELVSSLIVSAARTNDREQLSAIRAELVEALGDVFTILSESPAAPDLVDDLTGPLLERAVARAKALS